MAAQEGDECEAGPGSPAERFLRVLLLTRALVQVEGQQLRMSMSALQLGQLV